MAQTMQKLNVMGEVPNNNPLQIVNVTYGHEGSGKLYSYYGQNKRTGDVVTPEVTQKKSGKVYKTLGVVQSTHRLPQGQDTINYLTKEGKRIKTLGKTDQKSLPGYYEGWDKDAKAAKDLQHELQTNDTIPQMQKLNLMHQISKLRK